MQDVTPNPAMPRPDSLLLPGETAIWWDRPNLYVFARHEIIKAVICAAGLVVLILAWMRVPQLGAYQSYIFAGVLVLVAVGGSALVEVFKSAFAFGATTYLVTDQRLVVARKGEVKALPVASARKTLLYPLKDGFGDVKFLPTKGTTSAEDLAGVLTGEGNLLDLIPVDKLEDGFMSVANAAGVEAMIRARQAAA